MFTAPDFVRGYKWENTERKEDTRRQVIPRTWTQAGVRGAVYNQASIHGQKSKPLLIFQTNSKIKPFLRNRLLWQRRNFEMVCLWNIINYEIDWFKKRHSSEALEKIAIRKKVQFLERSAPPAMPIMKGRRRPKGLFGTESISVPSMGRTKTGARTQHTGIIGTKNGCFFPIWTNPVFYLTGTTK